ncbi:hypothetical protein POM88_016380 [Heracleum sosnowskyi]|uniref:Uncharacterized protein n=2 Tax=Heracleum sosnowskyi TaxID=360622 RepID=A0AAD8MXC2_9APIA|nr:hypothetical protein POM88_016380 [Heracleum sosnowskyi]
MATTAFVFSGLEFVPNNYAAPLNTVNAPEAFHMIQDFLAQSAIGRALVEPAKLSGLQIKAFWESGMYDDGGETGNPSIIFEYEETEYVITAGTIRAAMGFPEFSSYTIGMGDEDLIRMMREIGYSGPLNKIGQLKRPFLRKEWSFFFDCITRTFGKKCTNWDAIPTDSLQIGIFSDLSNKDVKKGVVGDLLLPVSVQQFLNDQVNPPTQAPSQPEPQPEPLQTELPPSTSVIPARGGRTKHIGTKPARSVRPSTDVGVSKTNDEPRGHYKKRRANRSKADNEDDLDNETLHKRKRRLVSNYLFDNVDEAVQHDAPEIIVEEPVVNADDEDRIFVNVEAPEVVIENHSANATVHEEARANTDATFHDDFLEPILEMNVEEEFEAHPSISIGDTEDVAADQPTQILNESLATHTEILSVNNSNPEEGEEVDQVLEAVQVVLDTTVHTEDIVAEAIPKEAEVFVTSENLVAAQLNAEKDEAIAEKVNDEAAQLNTEVTAENIANSVHHEGAQDDAEEDVPDSSNADFSANSVDTSQRVAAQHATDAHFQDMYFSNWSSRETIFSDERAADFVTKSSKEIQNPELLTHLKATIVQVKSLNNRFDGTDKIIDGLRNDIAARELTLQKDKSLYISLCKEQKAFHSRLSKVEENQAEMSNKLDAIANSLELLTSVLISDDVKKGERVSKDICKSSQTLTRKDDTTDGGAKDKEQRKKNVQEQGRRSNSDAKTNAGKGINTGGQSSSKVRSLLLSSQSPITDEEVATQLFLAEHGQDATVEDIQAEEQMLAEEHKKKVASGNYKKKSSIQYTRRPVITNTDKGKGILVEEGQLPKKNYSTSDIAQVESRISKSTSDAAHVDVSTKVVTTSDKAQVVQTQLAPQLKGFLRPALSETLTLQPVDFSQTRTVLGKESFDKSGLGSHREKRINNRSLDQTSLAEAGIGVSQESLDKLESVQMVYHRGLKKEVLLYFMSDGRVYRIGENDIQLKLWEELEYVLYLLKIKNKSTHDAALVIKDRMMKSKVLLGGGVSSAYIPKYRDAYGKIVEMKRNSAKFKTALGDPEYKELKEIMIAELERAERRLLTDYLRTVPDIQEIK